MKILLRIQLDFICFDFVENFPLYIYIYSTYSMYGFARVCIPSSLFYLSSRLYK